MTVARARAKTLILLWYDQGRPTPDRRAAFARDIDRFFDAIIARHDWRECLSTLLDDDGAASFSASGHGWRARPTGTGLAVTSVVPGWTFGWSKVLQTEETDYVLSWVGHYARQYVHRSNIAKVLMAAWERDGLLLHPFGSGIQFQRYSDFAPIPSQKVMFERAHALHASEWGQPDSVAPRYQSKWINRNTLDPAIHQAIYHFLRGQSLAKAGFELEALVAFDCVLHALQYMDWSWAPGNPRRERADLCRALGMGRKAVEFAEHAYFLRNQFVAHAGGWRWWDAVEYIDDDLREGVSNTAWRALRKAADIEPHHRTIDPEPTNWANWLIDHFPIIWSAIWFREQ